jgi:single-stranded-DNA-specific exonuclease
MRLESKLTNTLPDGIVRLLKHRGIDDINDFLSEDLKTLPDLTSLKDLSVASKRIIQAIEKNEKIAVYGDYDVDGTTSCALLFHFFQSLGIKIKCIQPSRFIEGYGIHPPTVDQAIEDQIKVLITVDCGITNNETADYALERGLDLIITDHHKDARDEMPNAFAVINPNRRDEDLNSPLTALAGVTVAFCLCWQLKIDLEKKHQEVSSLYPLLQFVAIGTICDLAKLNSMNLKLCRHGLKQIPNTTFEGIKTFFPPEERRTGFIPGDKIGFTVGPMINSKGRLEHPEVALKLLISDDINQAFGYYSQLEISNNERKLIQKEVFDEAIIEVEQLVKSMDSELKFTMVYQPHWHEGVIGIVASKLVDAYKVPSLVFTNSSDEGIIKASIRSAGTLNIFDCLNDCKDLFIKFGGHKAAAGLSMSQENFPILLKNLNKQLTNIPEIIRKNQRRVDIDLSPKEVTPGFVKWLEKLGPYSIGNEVPIFRIKGLTLKSFDILKDIHVRWNFESAAGDKVFLKGISFNYIGKNGVHDPEFIFEQQNIKTNELCVYCSIGINRWKGREYIQLMINEVTLSPFE